ncbi:hypothetical protein HPB52_024306 [Rhipicephalus sanguineus]|uniref:Uncharacterized protein n=1 Tax=Rhipicephalus sanguineus TaxID=34632 RepID=A0A9D4TCG2_RHISA|nr:hypothetical protein HPB52_024306 [Rhipicephalus sanguineus]
MRLEKTKHNGFRATSLSKQPYVMPSLRLFGRLLCTQEARAWSMPKQQTSTQTCVIISSRLRTRRHPTVQARSLSAPLPR